MKKQRTEIKDYATAGQIQDADPTMALITAIMKQAVDDYVVAYKNDNMTEIKRLEAFFLSDWGQQLSFDHGEYIIRHLHEICADENCDTMTHKEI